jgi:hypothetical protein
VRQVWTGARLLSRDEVAAIDALPVIDRRALPPASRSGRGPDAPGRLDGDGRGGAARAATEGPGASQDAEAPR